jgi:hypothetical protein
MVSVDYNGTASGFGVTTTVIHGDIFDDGYITASDTPLWYIEPDVHFPTPKGYWGYSRLFPTLKEAREYITKIDSQEVINELRRSIYELCDSLIVMFRYILQYRGDPLIHKARWKRKLYLKKLYQE